MRSGSSMEHNNNTVVFPYETKFVDHEINYKLLEDFHGEKTGFVQTGCDKWFFPSKYLQAAENFYNFEARTSDVWIATFPRSGTTWTQEMVWLICNKLNFIEARQRQLNERVPFFEFHMFMHDEMKKQFLSENTDASAKMFIEDISKPAYDMLSSLTVNRFIKTHFPFSLLPPSIFKTGAKVIYVARNPSDVVVSYYHLNKLYRTQGYVGDLESFYNYFEKGLVPWSPYWTHLKQAWNARHLPNVLFMFYEEMNQNLPATINKVANFLDKRLSDADVLNLCEHLSIDNFKNNPSINGAELIDVGILNSSAQGFIRKGQVNSSTDELTDSIKQRIKAWTEENLSDTDLKFPTI
ncbi:sulfotransferase 1E1 isoform X2 [Toxorhynchites rutilus septentrionalis]|nr:sulfotransferase 1E1 isoform X2 [Toxorhynchites rutilus septentrionalis]